MHNLETKYVVKIFEEQDTKTNVSTLKYESIYSITYYKKL